MADSDYDFLLTRNEILESAFEKIGVLDEGETLTGSQVSRGVRELNTLLAAWEKRDIKLWQRTQDTLTTIAATREYDAPTDPRVIGILTATYRYESDRSRDIPLVVWPFQRYLEEYVKAGDDGEPIAISFDITNEKIYVWPVPEDAFTIDVTYVSRLEDMDSASGSGNIPRDFQLAVIYGLALELAPSYGVTIGERDALEKRLNKELKEAKKANREIVSVSQCQGYY